HSARDFAGNARLRDEHSATRAHFDETAVADAEIRGIQRMYLQVRFWRRLHQRRDLSGASHRLPLIAHRPGRQNERKQGIRSFSWLAALDRMKPRPPIGGVELEVDVKARRARMPMRGAGPLQRTLAEPAVADTRDVNRRIRGQ